MVKSLRESKAKLSELVERASRGQDTLITVRGKVKARLTKAGFNEAAKAAWLRDLREFRKASSTGKRTRSVEEILDEVREDRF